MEHQYYNEIAEDYYNKRRKPWSPLRDFLDDIIIEDIKLSGLSVDLGCANGRNFDLFLKYSERIVGIDISIKFLQIIKSKKGFSQDPQIVKNVNLILADIQYLPIRPRVVDNIFSIATIHHIKGKKEREASLKQMKVVLRTGGYLLLTVWRRWQKKYRKYFIKNKIKRIFSFNRSEFGDKIVPWTVSSKKITINRFYHFYSKYELIKFLKDFQLVKIKKKGGSTKKDNFFVLARNK